MRRSRYRSRGQLVLQLERRDRPVSVEQSTQGLVEALADLLLAALRIEGTTPAAKGGVDEQQTDR